MSYMGPLAKAEAFDTLVRATSFFDLNANDVFAWAAADICQMDKSGLDLFLEVSRRWGDAGQFAFMAEGRGQEPQDGWYEKGIINRLSYDMAREFVRGKPTGIFISGGYEEDVLRAENAMLREENQSLKDELEMLKAPMGYTG